MGLLLKIILWALAVIAVLAAGGWLFVNYSPSESKDAPKPPMMDWLKSVVFPPKGKHPDGPLPTKRPDYVRVGKPTFTWYGHSTVLIDTGKLRILTDPVFYRASPVWPVGSPYKFDQPFTVDAMPYVDAVLISHDHYDHLDAKAIPQLDEKVGHFYVPLGVRAHLLRWGISDNKITELDWFEEAEFGDGSLDALPDKRWW